MVVVLWTSEGGGSRFALVTVYHMRHTTEEIVHMPEKHGIFTRHKHVPQLYNHYLYPQLPCKVLTKSKPVVYSFSKTLFCRWNLAMIDNGLRSTPTTTSAGTSGLDQPSLPRLPIPAAGAVGATAKVHTVERQFPKHLVRLPRRRHRPFPYPTRTRRSGQRTPFGSRGRCREAIEVLLGRAIYLVRSFVFYDIIGSSATPTFASLMQCG